MTTDVQNLGESFASEYEVGDITARHPGELPTTRVDIERGNTRNELMQLLRDKTKPLGTRTQREVLSIVQQLKR